MKTRLISTSFYASERVLSLSSSGRWLFMYLLTCPYIELTGAFKLAQSKILFETGLTEKAYLQAKNELQEKQLVFFIEQWIVIPGTEEKTGFNKGARTGKGYANEFSNLPQEIKDVLINKSVYPIENSDRSIAKSDSLINHKSENINSSSLLLSSSYQAALEKLKEDSSYLDSLADQYRVSRSFILSKIDDMDNWFGEKPSRARGRNFKKTLATWVKRDAHKFKPGSDELMSIDEVLELRRENGAVN